MTGPTTRGYITSTRATATEAKPRPLAEPLTLRGEEKIPALVMACLKHKKIQEAASVAVLLDVNVISGIVATGYFQDLERDEKINFLAYYVGNRSNAKVSILWHEDGISKGVVCNPEKAVENSMTIEIVIDGIHNGELIIASHEKLETGVELLVGQILDSANIRTVRITTGNVLSEEDERSGIFTISSFGQIVNAQLKEAQKVCIIKLEYTPNEGADYDRIAMLKNVKALIGDRLGALSFASIDANIFWICVIDGSAREIRAIENEMIGSVREMRERRELPAGGLLIVYFDSSNLQTQEFSPRGFEGSADKRPTYIPIS